jgi:hypothetical protein
VNLSPSGWGRPARGRPLPSSWRTGGTRARDILQTEPVQAAYFRQRLSEILLTLPGRLDTSEPVPGWSVPADEVESLRALGYVK